MACERCSKQGTAIGPTRSVVVEPTSLQMISIADDGNQPRLPSLIFTSDHSPTSLNTSTFVPSFGVKFKVAEVFDISQTDAIRNKKVYEKEYIDKILKGMCERRGLYYDPNNQMLNIESIVGDISQNTRQGNSLKYDVDKFASQSQVEVNATIFVVAKKLGINTRNYNLKDVCQWGIDKDTKTLKESLKYMQKFTNYFVKDFETQEKISKIEKQEQEEME